MAPDNEKNITHNIESPDSVKAHVLECIEYNQGRGQVGQPVEAEDSGAVEAFKILSVAIQKCRGFL